MVFDLRGRLARLEQRASEAVRCGTCTGVLLRRAVDVQNWPRGADGDLRCPTCGEEVEVQVLKRVERPEQEHVR